MGYKKLSLNNLEERFIICNLFFEMKNYMNVADINKFIFTKIADNPFKNKNTFYKFMSREYGKDWKDIKSEKIKENEIPD